MNYLSLFTKVLRKIFLLSLISMLVSYKSTAFSTKHAPDKEYKLATAIADEYLRSFSSQTEIKENIEATKKEILAQQARPPQLDVATTRKVIFNDILVKSNKLFAIQQEMEPILNTYAWSNLKLFYGTTTTPSYHLMSRINKTTTVVGEAVLATLLVTPTGDLDVLRKRQQTLRILLNNPTQQEVLKGHLQNYQAAEQSMISFWTSTDPLYNKEYIKYMEDRFYAKGNDASNKSAGWLEFKKRVFRDFLDIQYRVLWPFTIPLFSDFFLHKTIGSSTRQDMWKFVTPYYGGWWFIKDVIFEQRKTRLASGWPAHSPEHSYYYAIVALKELTYTWIAYTGISNYLEYSSVLRNLSLRMADVQNFVLTAEKVCEVITASPELEATYGEQLTAVRALLAQSKENTELGRLIGYLKKLPFKDWSYFFNNAGKLLAAHKLFIENKDAFADAMYEIGLLDSYLSFATLMQEANTYNSEHAYVFAQFLDRTQKQKPYVKLEGMWNPFLDSKQAVGNDLEMGGTNRGARTVILTGPNAGGKSTFLTGITHALLLTHVMGIAPAHKIVLTPFNKINTYIDIADDIAAGKSLFMAEVDRAQKHIQMLKNLKPEEFSFTIFDEPFSGTNPTEGAAAEYSVLKTLAIYTNSFTIVATHYPIVMLLEEREKDKGFANYKVYITHEGANRKLNYTYKVVPGRSTQAIAIDILKEQGYDTEMLAAAREIIEHPERYQAKF